MQSQTEYFRMISKSWHENVRRECITTFSWKIEAERDDGIMCAISIVLLTHFKSTYWVSEKSSVKIKDLQIMWYLLIELRLAWALLKMQGVHAVCHNRLCMHHNDQQSVDTSKDRHIRQKKAVHLFNLTEPSWAFYVQICGQRSSWGWCRSCPVLVSGPWPSRQCCPPSRSCSATLTGTGSENPEKAVQGVWTIWITDMESVTAYKPGWNTMLGLTFINAGMESPKIPLKLPKKKNATAT